MSHKKAGGTTRNLRDSQPKYLGIKSGDGQSVKVGQIIVRQRGTKIEAGKNVKIGNDHTLYAAVEGKVAFRSMRKVSFSGHKSVKKAVDVVTA